MKTRKLSLWMMAAFMGTSLWSGGKVLASTSEHVLHPVLSKKKIKTHKQLKRWMAFQRYKFLLHSGLRYSLIKTCQRKKVRLRPLADLEGKVSLKSRERRIIALDLKMRRLRHYLELLKKTLARNAHEQKISTIGYLVSDALFTLSSYGLSKSLKVPWLTVVMPVTLKVTSKLVNTNLSKLPRPSTFQTQIDSDMSRLIQIMQFRLNPGAYHWVACYLSSPKLRDPMGKRCHPDHPFIRNQHKALGKLWVKGNKIQKDIDSSPFLSYLFEFISHQRKQSLSSQQLFMTASSALLQMQIQFLQKMRKILMNDYYVWGCSQLKKQSLSKAPKRIAL